MDIVLDHPANAVVILAVCRGTSYCLRVADGMLSVAQNAGCTVSWRSGEGTITDLAADFGAGWVFGRWVKDEATWCQAAAAVSRSRKAGP